MVTHVDDARLPAPDPPRGLRREDPHGPARGGPRPGGPARRDGRKPVHLMSDEEKRRAPKLEDYFVDVGLPAERVRELVRPGDVVTRERTLTRLGDLVTLQEPRQPRRPLRDDRGAAGAGRARLRGRRRRPACRRRSACAGARVATARLRPDVGLAIDITLANDGADAEAPRAHHHARRRCGREGLRRRARSCPGGVDHLVALAEERAIPHQLEVMPRGQHRHPRARAGGRGRAGRVRLDPHPLRPPGGRELPSRRHRRLCQPCHGLLRDRPGPGGAGSQPKVKEYARVPGASSIRTRPWDGRGNFSSR